ncbi:unnamed protein product [Amoebophrya sp. A25]|nr:unnamed protein product [Amoebophrya sp. A25]|eukprot:GSA25T00012605001.1
MARRLQNVESELNVAKGENQHLRRELQTATKSLSRGEDSVQLYDVVSENTQLQKEIQDMKKFLADYGMVWVGGSSRGSTPDGGGPGAYSPSPTDIVHHQSKSTSARGRNDDSRNQHGEGLHRIRNAGSQSQPARSASPAIGRQRQGEVKTLASSSKEPSSSSKSKSPAPARSLSPVPGLSPSAPNVDINTIQSKLSQLSEIAEREAKIVKIDRVHKFDTEQVVAITFFKDGLRVADYPFYKYEQQAAQRVLRDILEGFFPYVLKQDYPEGVRLKAVDRLKDDYDAKLESRSAQESFLARLPKQIIMANGQIVSVRKEMEERLLGAERNAARLRAANRAELRRNDPSSDTQQNRSRLLLEPIRDDEHKASTRTRSPSPALPRKPVFSTQTPSGSGALIEGDEDACSILVKHREGSCRLSLPKTSTVAHLYTAAREKLGLLDVANAGTSTARPGSTATASGGVDRDQQPPLVLKIAFPPPTKLLANMRETLEKAGLFPNATVHLS